MMCSSHKILVWSVLLALTVPVVSDEQLSPVRQTDSGQIQGYIHTLTDGTKVERYLGVPYAAPPVGHRRFELPSAPQTWPGVLQTSSVSAACMQYKLEQVYIKSHAPDYDGSMSEDCLYLNIYVPRRQERTLVPVLIHVHGGSNEVGMGAMLHADVLASRGQLVVVTFNYRLGVFGFFHSPTLDIPANLGLHDQLMVFKWVQQNIGQFGGDPTKVTLQGHSAGSVDVGIHLLSPASTGLFRYAILQSGAPTAYWAVMPDPDLGDLTRGPLHHISDLGCPLGDKTDTVTCLKDINATRLSNKYYNHGDGTFHFTASVDGLFLLDHPIKLLDRLAQRQAGTFNGEALLMGVVKDEGSLTANMFRLMSLRQDTQDMTFGPSAAQMPDQFNDNYFALPDSILGQYKKTDQFEKLVHFVYKPWSDPYNVTAHFIRLSDLIGDTTFTAPTIQTADYLSRSNRTQLYVYSFEHRSDSSIYPPWMGVAHGDDLFHVFGAPLEGSAARNYTALDRSVSLAVMDLWAHFVKHGTPCLDNVRPEAYSDQQNYILITSNHTDVVLRQARHLRARHMIFWNTLLSQVTSRPRDTAEGQTTVTSVLSAVLCLVSVVSVAVILCLCRKLVSHRRYLGQTSKT